ncbi:MAG: exo-alpha-sialidase, partial [Verrucomicrobiales bacterium]|nr:exo-alpha-sialidase [Verrucomicrobiales bacterium]
MNRIGLCLVAALLVLKSVNAAETNSAAAPNDYPSMVDADGSLRFKFGEERLVLPRGLQPSLLRTKTGALVVQAQVPEKPEPTSRMVYPSAMETRVSRDDGKTWQVVPRKPHENGLNME